MWLLNQPSSAARTALVYITIGALTVIWTAVWFFYLHNNPPETSMVYYLCGGLFVSGLTLIGIGLGLGHIGRYARHADLPPQEIAQEITTTQTTDVVPVDDKASVTNTGVPANVVQIPNRPGRSESAPVQPVNVVTPVAATRRF